MGSFIVEISTSPKYNFVIYWLAVPSPTMLQSVHGNICDSKSKLDKCSHKQIALRERQHWKIVTFLLLKLEKLYNEARCAVCCRLRCAYQSLFIYNDVEHRELSLISRQSVFRRLAQTDFEVALTTSADRIEAIAKRGRAMRVSNPRGRRERKTFSMSSSVEFMWQPWIGTHNVLPLLPLVSMSEFMFPRNISCKFGAM